MYEIWPVDDFDKGYDRLAKALNVENIEKFSKQKKGVVPTQTPTLNAKIKHQKIVTGLLDNKHIARLKVRLYNKKNFTTNKYYVQTKTMGTMVPDEIINHATDYKPRRYETAMMFADVSGFTALSEKLSKAGGRGKGASKLSQVLNLFIGTMIQEILSNGGDVLKFSGDACLVIFKVTKTISMQDALHKAINTSIIIQQNYGEYKTDVGVTLRVKLALSVGEVYFALIGTEKISHYVIVGQPIWDVKAGEKLCTPGDIIVNKSAWRYVNESEYVFDRLNNYYNIVKGFTDSWRSAQSHRDYFTQDQSISLMENLSGKMSDMSRDTVSVSENSFSMKTVKTAYYSLRTSLNALPKRMGKFLKRFMIPPLMRAIEIDEPMEFLTEMRNVVIVFLNIVVKPLTEVGLIRMVDHSYKALCDIVELHEGIVNKVSLFDKDMMFLVIFGLRGYKHDLESQIALRCAADVRQTFIKHEQIISASIAVTTGETYCGVVGHGLRREYSALGMTVNKAARLMIAYPNRVTCDLDTFLNSKMETKHFVLQEAIYLKGIQNAGPVYEFHEITGEHEVLVPPVYKFPFLGNTFILQSVNQYLNKAIENYHYEVQKRAFRRITNMTSSQYDKSCLVLKGDTQQGKTRLLDYIFQRIYDEKIQFIKLTLHVNQLRIPYATTKLYLSRPLGFTERMTRAERQSILFNKLQNFDSNIVNSLSVFNVVFDVNFEESLFIKRVQPNDEQEIRKNLFKLLCQKVFQGFWVLMIDDIEFTDEESFQLFEVLYRSNLVFSIFTLGKRRKLSPSCAEILQSSYVEKLRLEPIDMKFQRALACQFLQVAAIPLDLERVLHITSNGNPGWIEAFLLSLVQSGDLHVCQMQLEIAISQGLVFSELFFQNNENVDGQSFLLSDWEMYALSFQGTALNGMRNQIMAMKTFERNDEMQVAILKNETFIEEYSVEFLTMNAAYLKMYDSLSSYEQLLCKCASVLGQKFLRPMLSYVISNSTDRMIAIAIRKLYDLGIFVCAVSKTIVNLQVNRDSTRDATCSCDAIRIPESCRDLPRYALCGQTQFSSPHFRDTVYNLLTDSQRKEYHNRALVYLENETQKCPSCGGGYFQEMFSDEDDFINEYNLLDDISVTDGHAKDSEDYDKNNIMRFSSSRTLYKQKYLCWPLIKQRKIVRKPLVLSYTTHDFTFCECNMILYAMYTQILEHCKGGDLIDKKIESQIEFASVCIKIENIPRAITLLSDAYEDLEVLRFKDNIGLYTYLYGKIFTLLGICHFSLKQMNKASELLRRGCKIMGLNIPLTDVGISLKTKLLLYQIKYRINNVKTFRVKKRSKIYISILSQMSHCLTAMFYLYKRTEQWKLAKLTAIWSLKISLDFQNTFESLVTSYANVLLISFHMGFSEKIYWMQEKALDVVTKNLNEIDNQGLSAIINLYTSLLYCQTASADKSVAIDVGFIILKIITSSQNLSLQWVIVPIMIELIMSYRKIYDAIILLNDFKQLMDKNKDKTGLTWYYALCMDILLDTSCTIITYRKCEKFYLDETNSFIYLQDESASRRFYCNMWLWCVRKEAWETANVWLSKFQQQIYKLHPQDLSVNVMTGIRFLEGLILLLISAIETRNVAFIVELHKKIKSLMVRLQDAVNNSKTHTAKFLLMKVFYKQVLKFNTSNIKKLHIIKSIALEKKDFLFYEIIQHNIKAWNKELSLNTEMFWLEHQDTDQYDIFNLLGNAEKIFPYSFPLPRVNTF